MKSKYKFLSVTISLLGMIFTGCNNAEYDIRDNSVYIAEATTAKTVNVAMETAGADVNIVVRLAKQLDYDVTVSIGLDEGLIEDYNAKNSTEYALVPSEYFSISDASVTIPAGNISTTLEVHIDNFDTKGKLYALPVVIENVTEGDISLSATQSQLLYLIAKPLIVSVPVMSGYTGEGVKIRPDQDWGLYVEEWTIEAWIRMSAYSRNNQAIFGNGSKLTEVYIRFGDANAPYNYLQIKTLGGQVQTERDLIGDRWYHWAFVYDGTTLSIYRDGELNIKFNPPAPQGPGGTVEFQSLTMIGSGSTYFPDDCAMSQVRFWKVARSAAQIKNNMYYEVDPTNTDLIGYWPMDEGSGNTFTDITGNGNDAVAGSNIIQRWENNVRFDQQ